MVRPQSNSWLGEFDFAHIPQDPQNTPPTQRSWQRGTPIMSSEKEEIMIGKLKYLILFSMLSIIRIRMEGVSGTLVCRIGPEPRKVSLMFWPNRCGNKRLRKKRCDFCHAAVTTRDDFWHINPNMTFPTCCCALLRRWLKEGNHTFALQETEAHPLTRVK